MNANPIRIALLAAAVAIAAVALAPAAEAGSAPLHERCVNVAPPGQFCRRCVDVGYHTGSCCQNVGTCGCIYVECRAALPSKEEAGEGLLLAAEPTTTECEADTGLEPQASADEGEAAAEASVTEAASTEAASNETEVVEADSTEPADA